MGRRFDRTKGLERINCLMFYTVSEFLADYPMARSSFYRLVKEGKLRITKFGRGTRIAIADAEAWAKSLTTICGSERNV